MDAEGRIITLEFEDFFVTQVYTPNAGDGLRRLDDRQIWDHKYADYLTELDAQKPVLATEITTLPIKRLIWQIQAAIDVLLVLPTKNVKALLTY